MTKLYGIDLEQEITPLIARDAIVQCFYEAHCEATELPEASDADNREYCGQLVRRAFESTDGDFDNPSKESINKAVNFLALYSKSFRDQEVIQKHYQEIKKILDLIK